MAFMIIPQSTANACDYYGCYSYSSSYYNYGCSYGCNNSYAQPYQFQYFPNMTYTPAPQNYVQAYQFQYFPNMTYIPSSSSYSNVSATGNSIYYQGSSAYNNYYPYNNYNSYPMQYQSGGQFIRTN